MMTAFFFWRRKEEALERSREKGDEQKILCEMGRGIGANYLTSLPLGLFDNLGSLATL